MALMSRTTYLSTVFPGIVTLVLHMLLYLKQSNLSQCHTDPNLKTCHNTLVEISVVSRSENSIYQWSEMSCHSNSQWSDVSVFLFHFQGTYPMAVRQQFNTYF